MNEPVDLRLLHTFHEVARLGSVTAAARTLGRSQPAVSHRLRALEADLGVQLVERVGRGLRLTADGRRLQEQCVGLMAMAEGVRRAMGPDRVEGPVRIGTLPTVTAHLLAPTFADLLATWPALRVEFIFALVPDLLRRVRSGELDLVVAVGLGSPSDLETWDLGEIGITALMAPRIAPVSSGRIRPEDLRPLRLLQWVGPPDPTFGAIDLYIDAHHLAGPATARIPHVETLRRLAVLGAGYTLLPTYTAEAEISRGELLSLLPVGMDLTLPVQVAMRSNTARNRGLDEVLSALSARPIWAR